MICNKRFHIVLPSSMRETEGQGLVIEVNGMSSEKPGMRSKVSMELENHLIHGVLHLNGFGHLLCLNGIHGGSDFVPGHHLMDLWDRMCNALQVRQISLIDVAKKGAMELRLVHGLAYGEPWFGRWGYKFGHGSYGITRQMYQRSLEALRAFPLSLLHPPLGYATIDVDMSSIAPKYQAASTRTVLTLGDLFRCMIELQGRLPGPLTRGHGLPMRRGVGLVPLVCEAGGDGRSRRRRGAHELGAPVGDPSGGQGCSKGLHWGHRPTGLRAQVSGQPHWNYIVRRMVNPVTKVLEYSLQDISPAFSSPSLSQSSGLRITRLQLMRDLLFLYKKVLVRDEAPSTATRVSAAIPIAVNIVLDTKHLVKDYNSLSIEAGSHPLHMIKLLSAVRLQDSPHGDLSLPHETITAPPNLKTADLKKELQGYYRNTYCGLRSFVADAMVAMESGCGLEETGLVSEGGGMETKRRLCAGGNGDEVVECLCGAKEDDGELMLSCDICEVLQHARCARVPNAEEFAGVFLCGQCEREIVKLPFVQ
ncbi:hypothetical protein HPP92_009316 [Vanilla planifolia]|uniref:Zinc finger PHD-type domain-containing protein n=1 Tax=Vanilla planifolia TaxID=51239 RepID=A0A835RFG3_VANPL|nr:hypothetical protein HPP92_009316 [Vanilla planifolia]